MTQITETLKEPAAFFPGVLPAQMTDNVAFYVQLMKDVIQVGRGEGPPGKNDAKLAMLLSGKSIPEKIEYALKVAIMAMGSSMEQTGQDPLACMQNQYEARRRQQEDADADEVSMVYQTILVARTAIYLLAEQLCVDASKLQVVCLDGCCWLSYIVKDEQSRTFQRVHFCVDDALVDFFTTLQPDDRQPIVKNILSQMPYKFLLTDEEMEEARIDVENARSEADDSVLFVAEMCVAPFLKSCAFIDNLMPDYYEKVRLIAVKFFNEDRFI